MRAGAREAVRQCGAALREVSATGLVSLLCAGAVAPVVAVVGGASTAVAAGAGVLGSVGANVLTEVVARAVRRIRGGTGQPPVREIERELVAEIEIVLAAGGDGARALRNDIATVLREVSAVGAALEAAVELGNQWATRRSLIG
jgi:hypothetical protein